MIRLDYYIIIIGLNTLNSMGWSLKSRDGARDVVNGSRGSRMRLGSREPICYRRVRPTSFLREKKEYGPHVIEDKKFSTVLEFGHPQNCIRIWSNIKYPIQILRITK